MAKHPHKRPLLHKSNGSQPRQPLAVKPRRIYRKKSAIELRKTTCHQGPRRAAVFLHHRSQLVIKPPWASKGIPANRRAILCDPGAFRSALEKRRQQFAAAGAKDFTVPPQHIGKVFTAQSDRKS